jgi:hypothetical protein
MPKYGGTTGSFYTSKYGPYHGNNLISNVGKPAGEKLSSFAKFSDKFSSGMGKVSLGMSMYNLTKIGSMNFAGQASSVMGTAAGLMSLAALPIAPFLGAASMIAGLFGGSSRYGLRGR